MHSRGSVLLVLTVIVVGLMAAGASAQCLYAADGAEGNDAANLMVIDPATGQKLYDDSVGGYSVWRTQ